VADRSIAIHPKPRCWISCNEQSNLLETSNAHAANAAIGRRMTLSVLVVGAGPAGWHWRRVCANAALRHCGMAAWRHGGARVGTRSLALGRG